MFHRAELIGATGSTSATPAAVPMNTSTQTTPTAIRRTTGVRLRSQPSSQTAPAASNIAYAGAT